MAAYTIQNLREVEDQAPNFGLSPQLEARMARVPLELENFGVSYQRIEPNFRVPFGHKHKNQEEVYLVVSGSMRAKVEEQVIELKQWDALRVNKDTMRSFVIYCEPWVQPTEQPFVVLARREGKNTEHAARSVLLRVVK